MTDTQFIKDTATKAAHKLHMPLGEIEPIKLIQMVVKFCPGAYLTSEYHMNKIIAYLETLVHH